MDDLFREYLKGASENISKVLEETDDTEIDVTEDVGNSVIGAVKHASGLFDRLKDNIAYVLGLPAAISGAFGFLWQSSGEEAALNHKVEQLEQAVSELKSENDLLGGGAKNFSLDMSGAPGGSVTVIIVATVLIIVVGLLFWYQNKRKKR
tara:strand:- start:1787 stop:2236 length:450 start_codon:yes stop_codon:yes gene_type:complete